MSEKEQTRSKAPDVPHEARWVREGFRAVLQPSEVERLISAALGHCSISAMYVLSDGFRNTNLKVELAGRTEPVVLRLYNHDPVLCRKEVDLIRLVSGSVPVPEILHAETDSVDGRPPFIAMRFIDGISVHTLRHSGDAARLDQVGYSAGRVLASIGQFSFEKSGWISAGPRVTVPLLEGNDPVPRFIGLCLESATIRQRMTEQLRDRVHALVWDWSSELAALDMQSRLVHGDLGHRNVLTQEVSGKWQVAAILDWEFAISASPLADIGHFLFRHERRSMDIIEPACVRGYLDGGGSLPEDWRILAGLLDLTAVCESLTHDELPESVVSELLEIIQATLTRSVRI